MKPFAGRHHSGRHHSGRHHSGRHHSGRHHSGRHHSGRHHSGRHHSRGMMGHVSCRGTRNLLAGGRGSYLRSNIIMRKSIDCFPGISLARKTSWPGPFFKSIIPMEIGLKFFT